MPSVLSSFSGSHWAYLLDLSVGMTARSLKAGHGCADTPRDGVLGRVDPVHVAYRNNSLFWLRSQNPYK